jgi:hypothetical protein
MFFLFDITGMQCKLCDAMFYNQKAYAAHNFHHKPSDLYLGSEMVSASELAEAFTFLTVSSE